MNLSRPSKRRKFSTHAASAKYAEEQNALFGTFPETLWLFILQKLEYPETLFAIANASSVFRDLQHNYKIYSHLFVLVWPILFNHIIHKTDFLENKRFYRSVTMRPRKVCKSWCSAIDNFFSTHPGHYPNSEKHFQVPPDKSLCDLMSVMKTLNLPAIFYASTKWRVRKLLPHFQITHEQTGRSPFVSGVVVLKYFGKDLDEVQDQVLGKYGSFVSHCVLELDQSEERDYQKLRDLMFQMPGLKSLKLKLVSNNSDNHHVLNSMPVLPNLRYLTVGFVRDHVANAFLSRHKELITHLGFLDTQWFYNKYRPVNCPNLNYFKAAIKEKQRLDLIDFAQNANTVEINLGETLSFFHILQGLEQKLPESCRTLILSFHDWSIPLDVDCQSVRLRLRNVQRLKLVLRGFLPIDFVLGMQNTLEVLHVALPRANPIGIVHTTYETWKSQPGSDGIMEMENIKFLSCLDQVEISNIWNMLPKLKVFALDMWCGRKVEIWTKRASGVKKRIWEDDHLI